MANTELEMAFADLSEGTVEQRSAEWFLMRAGKITASPFWKLFSGIKRDKEGNLALDKNGHVIFGAGAITYLTTKALEKHHKTHLESKADSAALRWGREQEPLAIAAYIERTGNTVIASDFTLLNNSGLEPVAGASLDGTAHCNDGIKRLLEAKCPYELENHAKLLMVYDAASLKEMEIKYYYQVQFGMKCAGLKYAHFISFAPEWKRDEFPKGHPDCLHIAEIEFDPSIEFDLVLESATAKINEMLKDYHDLEINRPLL
jgi:hypothetical protein